MKKLLVLFAWISFLLIGCDVDQTSDKPKTIEQLAETSPDGIYVGNRGDVSLVVLEGGIKLRNRDGIEYVLSENRKNGNSTLYESTSEGFPYFLVWVTSVHHTRDEKGEPYLNRKVKVEWTNKEGRKVTDEYFKD